MTGSRQEKIFSVIIREGIILGGIALYGLIVWIAMFVNDFIVNPGNVGGGVVEWFYMCWINILVYGYPLYIFIRIGVWVFRMIRRRSNSIVKERLK